MLQRDTPPHARPREARPGGVRAVSQRMCRRCLAGRLKNLMMSCRTRWPQLSPPILAQSRMSGSWTKRSNRGWVTSLQGDPAQDASRTRVGIIRGLANDDEGWCREGFINRSISYVRHHHSTAQSRKSPRGLVFGRARPLRAGVATQNMYLVGVTG